MPLELLEIVKNNYEMSQLLSSGEKAIIYNFMTFHPEIFQQIAQQIDDMVDDITGMFFFHDICTITLIVSKKYLIFFKLLSINTIHLSNVVDFTVNNIIESKRLNFSTYNKDVMINITKDCIELLHIGNDGVVVDDIWVDTQPTNEDRNTSKNNEKTPTVFNWSDMMKIW
jgi:hypothetical protein